jgi:hypothetical protein
LVALAFTTVVFIAVAPTVVQPYAVEWRSASEPLQSVLVPPGLTELIAADTIRIDPASSFGGGYRALADRRACHRKRCRCFPAEVGCPRDVNRTIR